MTTRSRMNVYFNPELLAQVEALALRRQVSKSAIIEAAVEDHAVPFGGFAHFASLLVFPLVGGGNRHVGHLIAAGKRAHFGVAAQVTDDDDFIDRCHSCTLQ